MDTVPIKHESISIAEQVEEKTNLEALEYKHSPTVQFSSQGILNDV